MDTDDGALGDRGMPRDRGFEGARREAMARDVDHVVRATHDVEIAVLVDVAAITRGVEAGEGGQVRRHVAVIVTPERGQRARRQGQTNGDVALGERGDLVTVLVKDAYVVAGYGPRR